MTYRQLKRICIRASAWMLRTFTISASTCKTHQTRDWFDWHASIDPERESLLLHEDKPRLVAEKTLVDMFTASGGIQWNDLVERLRDVESPLSLFDGHEALRERTYTGTTIIRVIPAIALIAVSLNTYVARSNLSCEGDLFMAFRAWSSKEQEYWMSMSPGFRAKWCTIWESTVHHTSRAMRIPYIRRETVSFICDGSPAVDSGKITWAAHCPGSDGQSNNGELFVEGRKVCARRGQCLTSENLYNTLREYYLGSCSYEPWHALMLKALTAIHRERKASEKYATSFWRKIQEKVDGPETIPAMLEK
ncbi:hypothetical protein COCVIDRAFT_42688 [Bipolaris victoriae FI3]|uniref:Uncharacterized protein n=1 Tax=Bipolaris victoriae (strain FI3) TaxID=930091 RepID=W7E5N9_BIPV3|nr:hypothetical protein COCVIDRAFT_42688 [Bipolaris victoriae FI3]